jgi:hypothetical protein
MTRKRFIKLLMAMGLSRNAANARATLCQYKGKSYAEEYKCMEPWLRVHREAHRITVSMRAHTANFRSSLARATAAAAKLGTILQGAIPVKITMGGGRHE